MTAAEALQAAVHAVLAADAPLAALVGDRIHDTAPRGAATPYVAIGEWRATPIGTSDGEIVEHRFDVAVVTREEGRRAAVDAVGRIAAALDAVAPAPAGHRLVGLAVVATRSAPARDRRSFEVVTSFRAVTEADG